MTHVATMGTFSCATISIGSFKGNALEMNEAYKKDPKSWQPPKEGLSVQDFSNTILYPTRQDLGRTYDMPFTKLMEDVQKILGDKMISIVLNNNQLMGNEQYWPKELKKWGFTAVKATRNNWGQVNTLFLAIPNEVPVPKAAVV